MKKLNYHKEYRTDGTNIEYQNVWDREESSSRFQKAPTVPDAEIEKIISIMRTNNIRHLDIYDFNL